MIMKMYWYRHETIKSFQKY